MIARKMDCDICKDTGYLNSNEHCDCDRGVFYEGRDEYNERSTMENGFFEQLDEEWDELTHDGHDWCKLTEVDRKEMEGENLLFLGMLPFYDGDEPHYDYEEDWVKYDEY